MSTARLILLPAQPEHVPADIQSLCQALIDLQFIQAAPYRDKQYLPGDDFLNLLTFMGCSPNINLHPDEGENFCFVAFSPGSDEIRCLGYTGTAFAKCPGCRARFKTEETMDDWYATDRTYTCQRCHTEARLSDMDWRKEAGYGRFSITVANIHPHEAVPADKLLDCLHSSSGFDWNYFYATNEEQT